MPHPNDSAWALRYDDPRSSERVLLSLPNDMLADIKLAAEMEEISISEFLRRAATEKLVRTGLPMLGSVQ